MVVTSDGNWLSQGSGDGGLGGESWVSDGERGGARAKGASRRWSGRHGGRRAGDESDNIRRAAGWARGSELLGETRGGELILGDDDDDELGNEASSGIAAGQAAPGEQLCAMRARRYARGGEGKDS